MWQVVKKRVTFDLFSIKLKVGRINLIRVCKEKRTTIVQIAVNICFDVVFQDLVVFSGLGCFIW